MLATYTAPLWPKQCPLSVKSVPSMFCPPFCIHWLTPLILHCAVWLALCLHLFALPYAASSAGVTYQVVKLEASEDSRHRPFSRTVGADKSPLAVCQSQSAQTLFTIVQDGWASFPLLLSCPFTKQSRPSLFPYGRSARHRISSSSTFTRFKTDLQLLL
jgi:hypothetical protein